MNILSIQSHVAFGHVGNASAVFPLQRLGHEVWPIHTVQFSNHTGYGAWRGRVFDADMIDDVVAGIAERSVLPSCAGVLSGYMGASEIGAAILRAVGAVRDANPQALYACDPVIGDVGRGIFVRPGIPEFMRDRVVPAADIVTPNHFELDFLTGGESRSMPALRAALARLQALGPKVALVTSVHTEETPADSLDLVAVADGQGWRLRTPRLDVALNGAGDAIAALFFAHFLETRDGAAALSRAGSSIYGVLTFTAELGARELQVVAAQEEFVTPSRIFVPERVW